VAALGLQLVCKRILSTCRQEMTLVILILMIVLMKLTLIIIAIIIMVINVYS
jgi:hypothetical protein